MMILICKKLQFWFLTVIVLFTLVSASDNGDSDPLWVQIFTSFSNWNGSYTYKNETFPCRLRVNSVHPKTGINATLFSGDTQMEISGVSSTLEPSQDHLRTMFSMTRLVKAGSHFSPGDSFQVYGTLERIPGYDGWEYIGLTVSPEYSNLQGLNFSADNGKISPADPYSNVNVSLRVGLTIGLSLTCAFLGAAVMVGITIWAIRKGYLRHVPFNYKTFKNPSPSYSARDNSLHM